MKVYMKSFPTETLLNHKKPVLYVDNDTGVGFPIEEIISKAGLTLDKDLFKEKYLGKVITITLWKESGKSKMRVETEK